jgi:hypothetical protein
MYHPSEYDATSMSNATLVIAAHVTTVPDATPDHFGALVDDARVAIAAVHSRLDVYRTEIHERLRDGRMSEGEFAALYERVAGARLENDPYLARLGVVAV